MTGARKFAFDHILPQIPDGCTVLDVGAGDSPLAGVLAERGCAVTAIDRDLSRCARAQDGPYVRLMIDLCETPWSLLRSFPTPCDRIVAVYSLQHLLGDEGAAWREIRRLLRPDGKAIIVQRYATQCGIEANRADPLNAYNRHGVEALCLASGLRIESFKMGEYTDTEWFGEERNIRPNVFCLTVTK